jgi:hypothetical protein
VYPEANSTLIGILNYRMIFRSSRTAGVTDLISHFLEVESALRSDFFDLGTGKSRNCTAAQHSTLREISGNPAPGGAHGPCRAALD